MSALRMAFMVLALAAAAGLIACDGGGGDGDAGGGADAAGDSADGGDGDSDVDADADADGDADAEGDAAGDGGGEVDAEAVADAGGPRVQIHIRATGEAFAHDDGYAGQTPRDFYTGIRAFSLLEGREDPSPAEVFDHGDGFVEAGYNDGDDTVVGSAPLAALEEGHYTYGRVTLSHHRYVLDATVHNADLHVPGDLSHVQALSDGTRLDDETRMRGWFRTVFTAGGLSFPREGTEGVPIPMFPTGAPIETVVEIGETVLYFPVDITVSHSVTSDVHQVIEFNVHDAFRWEDVAGDGYADDVFDVTPTGWEPVRRFGANSYTIYVD